MVGYSSKARIKLGLGLWFLLTLSFQDCGTASSIEGLWMAPVSPYERLYLRFKGRTCHVNVFDGENWLKPGENIEFDFRQKEHGLRFVRGETSHFFHVAFFRERDREYIRLLFYRQDGTFPEEQTPPSPFETLVSFYGGDGEETASAKTLFFERLPNWVQNDHVTNPPNGALTGLWIGRDGKGEDGSALYFSNLGDRHIQVVLQDSAGSLQPAKAFRLESGPGNFRLIPLQDADDQGAHLEFFDRERIRLVWSDPPKKPADPNAQSAACYVKQPESFGVAFELATRIGAEQGVAVSLLRPSFFARDPERHAGAFSPELGDALLAALPMIERELAKYPQSFVSTYLDQIVLAPMSGTRDPIVPGHAQVHREKRILFVDPHRITSPFLFHHMFFQLVDAQYMGRDRFLCKTDWLAVNRRAGYGGRYDRALGEHPLACALTETGFVNNLAKRGYGDDRAQVFAALLTEGGPCQPAQTLARHEPTVEKIYLLYENYPSVLKPYIQRWINDFGLPVRTRRPLPTIPSPAIPETESQSVETDVQTLPEVKAPKKTVVQQPPEKTEPPKPKAAEPEVAKKQEPKKQIKQKEPVLKAMGRLDIYLAVSRKGARDSWKEIVLTIDGKSRPLTVEDPKMERIESLEIEVGTHTINLTSEEISGSEAIGVQVSEGATTRVDFVVKGRKGLKLKVLVNEREVLEGNLEKAGDQ